MKQLTQAVLAVMKAIDGIEKNMRIGTGNSAYNGISDQEVKQIVREAMMANGLVILPTAIQPTTKCERWDEVDPYSKIAGQTKSKQSVFTEVKVKYLLLHESGESVELVGYGHGVDSQDKAAGKATTYALKYALLYTFLIPTGKIDDADNTHSNDITSPPNQEQQTRNYNAANAAQPQIPQPKPKIPLEQPSENYTKVLDAIKSGSFTIAQVKTKYELTAAQEAEFNKIIKTK